MIFTYRKKIIILIAAFIGGFIINMPLLWREALFFIKGQPAIMGKTFLPHSPCLAISRVMKLNFFSEGNFILWVLYPLIITVIICGLLYHLKGRPDKIIKTSAIYTCLLLAYTAIAMTFGGKFLFNTNPMRTVFIIFPLLALPAAAYIKESNRPYIFNFIIFLLSATLLLMSIRAATYKPILPHALPGDFTDMASWINKNAAGNARIIVEDAEHRFSRDGRLIHPLYDSHILPLLGILTEQDYAGGIIPWSENSEWTFSYYADARIFSRSIESFSLNEIKEYFKIYNIGWVICWTGISESFFLRYPEYFTPEKSFGLFRVFSVKGARSFLHGAAGRARFNRVKGCLEVSLDKKADAVVLKYHWWKRVKTSPPLEIEKIKIGDDPAGFIKVKRPCRNFTVTFGE